MTSQVEKDDADAVTITYLAAFGTVVVLVLVVLLQYLYYRGMRLTHEEKDIKVGYVELRQITTEQKQQLESYRWVDKDSRTIAVPIDKAMSLTVDRLRSQVTP